MKEVEKEATKRKPPSVSISVPIPGQDKPLTACSVATGLCSAGIVAAEDTQTQSNPGEPYRVTGAAPLLQRQAHEPHKQQQPSPAREQRKLPRRRPSVLAEVDGTALLEEQEDEAVVARPHGREGGVMAHLLTRLDVTAWDVGPEHKHIYTHFPPADSSRTANHSAMLRCDFCPI